MLLVHDADNAPLAAQLRRLLFGILIRNTQFHRIHLNIHSILRAFAVSCHFGRVGYMGTAVSVAVYRSAVEPMFMAWFNVTSFRALRV